MMTQHFRAAFAAFMIISSVNASAAVATFDDLPLAASSHYFPVANTTFTSGSASFNHDYADYGIPDCCWSGWVYSNETDTTTAGYTNQYSAYTGEGALGSANFGVAYMGAPTVTFAAPSAIQNMLITNTTYTALSMQTGDSFAKKFGGATGNDADYLLLTITGLDAASQATGNVDFYLADYRFSDNSQDYIVNQWSSVDLSILGTVSSLKFSMSSSDIGDFGMNTPAYFAVDNLSFAAVPEAGTNIMLVLGLLGIAFAVRIRRV